MILSRCYYKSSKNIPFIFNGIYIFGMLRHSLGRKVFFFFVAYSFNAIFVCLSCSLLLLALRRRREAIRAVLDSKITKRGLVWHGEFHPCPNQPISSTTKSEPSDKPPQLIKASFTLFKDYDIVLRCILHLNK